MSEESASSRCAVLHTATCNVELYNDQCMYQVPTMSVTIMSAGVSFAYAQALFGVTFRP
jgi:hypothetical protein